MPRALRLDGRRHAGEATVSVGRACARGSIERGEATIVQIILSLVCAFASFALAESAFGPAGSSKLVPICAGWGRFDPAAGRN